MTTSSQSRKSEGGILESTGIRYKLTVKTTRVAFWFSILEMDLPSTNGVFGGELGAMRLG